MAHREFAAGILAARDQLKAQGARVLRVRLDHGVVAHERFAQLAEEARAKQRQIEDADTVPFEIYRQQYLSAERLNVT